MNQLAYILIAVLAITIALLGMSVLLLTALLRAKPQGPHYGRHCR